MATHLSILAMEDFMDRGAWQATVNGVAMSQTFLSDWACTTHTHTHTHHVLEHVKHSMTIPSTSRLAQLYRYRRLYPAGFVPVHTPHTWYTRAETLSIYSSVWPKHLAQWNSWVMNKNFVNCSKLSPIGKAKSIKVSICIEMCHDENHA